MPPKERTTAEKGKTKPVEYNVDDENAAAAASGDEGIQSTPFTYEAYLSEHGHSTFPEVSAHYMKQKKELKQTTITAQLKRKAVSEPSRERAPVATYTINAPVRGDKQVLYPRRKTNPSTTMVQGRKRQLSHRNNYNKYLTMPKRRILDL